MREMLFRGKRTDTGQWVRSGSISRIQHDDDGPYVYYIGSGQSGLTEFSDARNVIGCYTLEECLFYEVDTETVGQFTGFEDVNGEKIFEGDILSVHGALCKVAFERGQWVNIYRGGYWSEVNRNPVKIIGNIYDNPELLEG